MKSQKIVLANSTGKDDHGYYIIHSPSRWSCGVKSLYSWFAYYPWELGYTSSLLKKYTNHKIKLIDPCLRKWNKEKTLNEILKDEPDWLIIESATRTIKENLWLAKKVKEITNAKIVFVGQHASAYPEELLKQGIDYVCLGEYEYTILELIMGKDNDKILGLYPNPRRPLIDINTLPFPEDEDVKRIEYGIPGEPSSEYLEIQAYGSRGCFSDCNFCVARNIYYAQKCWRPRYIENIILELNYLKEKYPQMEGIFFDEEVHNGSKEFISQLTQAIKENGLDKLKYEAMCDLRLLDEEMLNEMRSAGYYKIRFGIETMDKNVSKGINKFIPYSKIIRVLKYAKSIGIKTYGTFMLGALNSSYNGDKKTIEFMRDLLEKGFLDNAQISIATPQPGTPFYEIVKKNKWLRTNNWHEFDGENFAIVGYDGYDPLKIMELKKRALLIRDHICAKKKIKRGEFLRWIYSRYKRYGMRAVMVKSYKRLLLELRYLLNKYKFVSFNKRIFDFILSIFFLFIFSPIMVLISILIKFTSKGPVFFIQERAGKDGKIFKIYKFRTIKYDSPLLNYKPPLDDPHLTKLGKFLRSTALDELPQLFNVIKGEMSLVGPRPELPFIVKTYTSKEKRRLEVKPGITGPWQLSGKTQFPIHYNIEYDLHYIDNSCLSYDCKILFKTLLFLIRSLFSLKQNRPN